MATMGRQEIPARSERRKSIMRSIPQNAWPLIQGAWGHRWLGLGVAWVVCVAGWGGVALLPTAYDSMARVYINADPILTPLLRGLAADTDPTRQVDYMRRTLLSRPNLEETARLAELDMGEAQQKEGLLKGLATAIRIDAITPNLLTISFRTTDPQRAKNVVQSLLTIFAEKTTGNSRMEMDRAQQFLDGEIAAYQEKLRAADLRRAEFIRQYPDLLPMDKGGRVEQVKTSVAQLELQLSDAIAIRDSVQKRLVSVQPMLSVDRGPQVFVDASQGVASTPKNVEEARRALATLRLKYTDEYPDVIAARRQVAQLEAEARNPTGAGLGQAAAKAQIANAVYDQLQLKLADAEGVIVSIQRKLDQARANLPVVEAALQAAPGITAKAQDLDRDYNLVKAAFEALVQRRQAAQIADSANTKTDQIQFRIVDPPQVPIMPAAPNRSLLDSVVLLLGIGAGLSVPVGLVQFDRSVATVRQLRGFGVPIVGSVSLLISGAMRQRTIRQLAVLSASTVILLVAYGTLMLRTTGFNLFGMS
jgi:polysaccharide chain length determinant protein (PEP-CTERM system associated)